MDVEESSPLPDPDSEHYMSIEEENPIETMYGVGVKAINRFVFKGGKLLCDVDVMNKEGICVGVRLI
jgi:hypothetical protein